MVRMLGVYAVLCAVLGRSWGTTRSLEEGAWVAWEKSLHTVARRALRSCRDRPAARLDVTAKHAPALQSVDVARTCSQCWLSYDL